MGEMVCVSCYEKRPNYDENVDFETYTCWYCSTKGGIGTYDEHYTDALLRVRMANVWRKNNYPNKETPNEQT